MVLITQVVDRCHLQLSAAGDSGSPEVVVDPQGQVAKVFSDIGVCAVKQCAKLRQQGIYYIMIIIFFDTLLMGLFHSYMLEVLIIT